MNIYLRRCWNIHCHSGFRTASCVGNSLYGSFPVKNSLQRQKLSVYWSSFCFTRFYHQFSCRIIRFFVISPSPPLLPQCSFSWRLFFPFFFQHYNKVFPTLFTSKNSPFSVEKECGSIILGQERKVPYNATGCTWDYCSYWGDTWAKTPNSGAPDLLGGEWVFVPL